MYFLLRFCTGTLAALLLAANSQAAIPTLTVYTYDSFTSEWGPGPQVKKAFEAQCGCKLDLIGLEDGVAMLNRLRLEGENTRADILLGIDTSLTAEARATGLFEAHGLKLESSSLPRPWNDELFLPYDYGYFAFVYNRERLAVPPQSLRQLVEDEQGPTILIQDPRTSTPGLGLLLWIRKVYGDRASDAWARLSPRIVTVSKGWSEAYGLFLKNEADMVLSYTTSPAYHLIAEQDDRFAAAPFSEGHYQQIEVAGMLHGSRQKKLAREFLEFMLGEDFQRIIPTTNWMYPAALPSASLPPEFTQLIDPGVTLLFDDEQVAKHRKIWVDEWLEVMSR
ncbi:MAG: thiamine ABC transporter substrate binding subunit [Gammaproteobacteria bacterium]|nr:thiamine ABC transporter substrate binding subunit [Gammaproteobacteria bacterium]MDH3536026.1 thiamine ABC transporter substrate binding subunit [Gammaproteobacteria bacterium]